MIFEREEELKLLEEMYASRSFEMFAVYARRRQGKTALLSEFAKRHKSLYFCARQVTESKQLDDFFKAVTEYFGDKNYSRRFRDWQDAFDYVSQRLTGERTVIIFDEYPVAVSAHKSVKNELQRAISRNFEKSNVLLILSGSDVAYMKEEFIKNKREYYDNLIALNLAQPDYADVGKLLAGYTNSEKLKAYAVFGGTPAYISSLDPERSVLQNIETAIEFPYFLKEEPKNLLAEELREPAVYNAILEALACGAKKMSEIAGFTGEEANKCSKYLDTLRAMELVEKNLPLDESGNSKRGLYRITDNYFSFWFRFVFGCGGLGKLSLSDEEFADYFAGIFPSICSQYLTRKNMSLSLPFHFTSSGFVREETSGRDFISCAGENKAIIADCLSEGIADGKTLEIMERMRARKSFYADKDVTFFIFASDGFDNALAEAAAERGDIVLISMSDMFDFES